MTPIQHDGRTPVMEVLQHVADDMAARDSDTAAIEIRTPQGQIITYELRMVSLKRGAQGRAA